ncbi:CDP-alcohol phosphatidyltransferase family protein [Microbispora hainanensis]|uniref:CDP-alcohol phosphatidyltransferase family protein n=1 Tax=Microbispora hainanensis TaxID=568844 RepID=A0ABZ1SIQ0_9ACTN|nr:MULTISPECIES: CDP-alcohol phosphatidyltransferase family protein [Microbispora]NJP24293.1 CDP-alcohol phosphatidyltransferase family protein [Microbispora sp. CL1-1]TQS15087.1 CDP-alcohol phosphatidyltransferase family protein [Microbispora sp. SCL1-1]
MGGFTLDDILATRKPRDSWWTVFMVDPLACRLALLVANHTSITPNALTRLSMLIGFASAAAFTEGMLVAGAVLFYLSFTVDCMDGKIARLKGTGTPFGLWLDYVGDRVRVVCCAFGWGFGEYTRTGDTDVVLAAVGVVVLDLFRYINGPQLKRVKDATRALLETRLEGQYVLAESVLRSRPRSELEQAAAEFEQTAEDTGATVVDLQKAFHARFPWYDRFRVFLVRHRVRTHVVSGIEFHAAVFVVAPLFGAAALVPVAAVAGTLLLTFEMFLVYRVWLASRQVPRTAAEREKILV